MAVVPERREAELRGGSVAGATTQFRPRGGESPGLAVESPDLILDGLHLAALEVRLAALSTHADRHAIQSQVVPVPVHVEVAVAESSRRGRDALHENLGRSSSRIRPS